MINDLIANYLDSVEEREFDAPFIALLRSMGYWDIHFLHGAFEFGKDFIAKGTIEGTSTQLAFQTKAGDINLAAWNESRGQIDMLRTDATAHPAFDAELPRKAVFVTTGRLVGGAAIAAQQYQNHLDKLGELEFVTWDKSNLLDMISAHPGAFLEDGLRGAFLTLVGRIDQGQSIEREIEIFSRSWMPSSKDYFQIALEASVIAQHLRRAERLDLAAQTALMLLRASWSRAHGSEPPDLHANAAADGAIQIFRQYGWALFERCNYKLLDPIRFRPESSDPTAFVTYPVFCQSLIEVLGLLYLLDWSDDKPRRDKLGSFVVKFVRTNPGACHPISDRRAASIAVTALLLMQRGERQAVEEFLRSVTKWVADRYESTALGLCESDCTPSEEVDRLLGEYFEHITLEKRQESYVATVVLDLAAIFKLSDILALATNEFLAVELLPSTIEVGDTPSQYSLQGDDIAHTHGLEYEISPTEMDGWWVAAHHRRAKADYYLQRIERYWEHLTLSSVLRDRHFLETWRYFVKS